MNGTWGDVKPFSEQKVNAYWATQGVNAACFWAGSEPIPQVTTSGPWGGTWTRGSDPTVNPCTGQYGVTWKTCPVDTRFVEQDHLCAPIVDVQRGNKPPKCGDGVGNPIYPLVGAKRESVNTRLQVGREALQLVFDSSRQVIAQADGQSFADAPGFGALWLSSLHRKIVASPNQSIVQVYRGNGQVVSFQVNGTVITGDADLNDRLINVGGLYRYIDASTQSIESYDTVGKLTSVAFANGQSLTFAYSDANTNGSIAPAPGYLIQVTDSFSRSLHLSYSLPIGGIAATDARVTAITDAGGLTTTFGYDAHGNLSQITWADSAVRQFLYEASALPWALTGLTDERGIRFATFGYDGLGRAVSSEHAGAVYRYSVAYDTPPQPLVREVYDSTAKIIYRYHEWQLPINPILTDPTGSAIGLGSASVFGYPHVSTRSQPAGAGCAASTSSTGYDTNGNVAVRDDFNSVRACYSSDLTRNLEVVRVEGLGNTTVCSGVTPVNATLPAGSRKISTAWHPDWRLEVQRTEPTKSTTSIYNGQPNPLNGNATASCAPSAATLPDGKPIAVLCSRVEQATLDANGGKGLTVGGVPASGADASFNNVSLLLHMDGADLGTSFLDSSSVPKNVIANGGATTSTTVSKFGGASLKTQGGGKWLTTPHTAALDLSTGDFTIEMWVYPQSAVGAYVLYNKALSTGYYAHLLFIDTASHLNLRAFDGGTTQIVNLVGTTAVTTNAWHHIAATRSGSTFTTWVDGVSQGTATSTAALRSNSSEVVSIAAYSDGSYAFDGWIDDLRVTKGVARYTGPFTVPSAAFGNSVNGTGGVPSSLDASVPARTWTYTYNQYGQVLTAKGPRTDVNDTTTYAYYTDTTVDHTLGDLQTVTNALGKITQYAKYNKYGQVLRIVDPNNVITDYTYDSRQRVTSVTMGGQTTTYAYDAAGQLIKVTQPDASYVGYAYDDAQRLVAVFDNKNNRVDYTLDNAGNRIAESVKDPANVLARQVTRAMDALGRVQQTTGRQ